MKRGLSIDTSIDNYLALLEADRVQKVLLDLANAGRSVEVGVL